MGGRAVQAIAAAAAVLAGFASVAEAAPVPAVAGETVVVAQRTARMRVHVPRRATVAIDTAKAFDADGAGRLVGLILTENAPHGPDEAGWVRLPAQLGSRVYQWGPGAFVTGCTTPVPEPLPALYTDCTNAKFPTHFTLRRGTYTLYALTDGAPVRFTLRFANLGGSTELRPSAPVASGTAALTKSVDTAALWSGGAAVSLPSAADVFTLGWWKQDESAAATVGACSYDATLAPLGTYRWAPGCPAASGGTISEVRNPLDGAWGPAKGGAKGVLGTSGVSEAGDYGFGVWANAQGIRDTAGFVYWFAR